MRNVAGGKLWSWKLWKRIGHRTEGREPDELDLASQPTISRLENGVTAGDLVVLPTLLFGDAIARLSPAGQLQRVIERLRERFPDTPIHVRADSAFGGPEEYSTLESSPEGASVPTVTESGSTSRRLIAIAGE